MNNRVHFNSKMFHELEDEHNQSHSNIVGKELALWIRENLPKHGTRTNEVIAEDWGWLVTVPSNHCSMVIGCSNENGTQDHWACFVESEESIFEKLLDHANVEGQINHVIHSLDHLLKNNRAISGVTWDSR